MVGFKLTKNSNYKEKVSWSFRLLGSGSLDKRGRFQIFSSRWDNNIKNGYLPNRCAFSNQDLIPVVHEKLQLLPINGFKH